MHGRHLRARDQQSRHDAGEVHRGDRGRDQPAPHDHQDRGRDDDGEHGRDRGDGDGEREVVTLLGLGVDEDLGLARRVRGGGAGDAGKEHRQHDIDLRQRSRPMPDHRARQRDQAVGDAADAHQVGGQQEERHRQQDERIVGVEGLLRERHDRQMRLDQKDRHTGKAERKGDRHANDEQADENPEQDHGGLSGRKNIAAHCFAPTRIRSFIEDLFARKYDPRHARPPARRRGSSRAADRPVQTFGSRRTA